MESKTLRIKPFERTRWDDGVFPVVAVLRAAQGRRCLETGGVMLCLEIWVNGKKLLVAGHKDALILMADVMYHRADSKQWLNISAVAGREGIAPTDHMWEAPRLSVGDEVLIELVEAEAPSTATYETPYGMKMMPP